MTKLANLAIEDIPAFAASYAGFLAEAHETFSDAPTRLQHRIRISDYIRFRAHKRRRKKPVKQIFDHLIDSLGSDSEGVVLEFGVHEGISTRIIGNALPNAKIHGFDSFVGFPEDGRTDWTHDFSVANLPEVPDNTTLHQGFFEDTLGPFMSSEGASFSPEDVLFIHIDCDIYSSTVTVLDHLSPLIGPGSIIVFDELMNNPPFATNEFLALYEFLKVRNLDFAWHTDSEIHSHSKTGMGGWIRAIFARIANSVTTKIRQLLLPNKRRTGTSFGAKREVLTNRSLIKSKIN